MTMPIRTTARVANPGLPGIMFGHAQPSQGRFTRLHVARILPFYQATGRMNPDSSVILNLAKKVYLCDTEGGLKSATSPADSRAEVNNSQGYVSQPIGCPYICMESQL
jgi:hypothetical protein